MKEGPGNRTSLSLSVGDLRGEPGGRGSFTGDREGYVKEGCVNGRLLP